MVKRVLGFAGILLIVTAALFAAGDQESGERSEPVTLSLYMPGPGTQDDEEMVESALSEYSVPLINADMDVNFVGWGEWFDKKRLMIASGEEFDIGFTAVWNQFEDEVARNAWLPLNDLIDEHAPELYGIVGDFLKGPTIDGNIYAISTVKEQADGGQFLLNKEWADYFAIPYEELASLDDVEPWLEIIQAEKPELAGWFMDPGNTSLVKVEFAYLEPVYGDYFLDPDDMTIKHRTAFDRYWDAIERAYRWNQAGYFQDDLEDQMMAKNGNEKLKEGQWVFYHHVNHPGKPGEMTGSNGFPIVGGGPYQQPVIKQQMLLGSMFAISRTSQHPEEAIQMLALMNKDKYVNNLLNFGVEGEHYEFVDEEAGIIRTIEDSGYAPNMTWALQNQFLNYLRDFEDPDKWDKYIAFNESARLGDAVGFFPDVNPVKTQLASLQNAIEEYANVLDAGFIEPTAEVKEDILSKLEAAGVHEVEAELQRQFDAFLANKSQ